MMGCYDTQRQQLEALSVTDQKGPPQNSEALWDLLLQHVGMSLPEANKGA